MEPNLLFCHNPGHGEGDNVAVRTSGAQGVEEEGGCPHVFLCDIPDVVHIFDIALMLNSSNGDGLFTHFGGDIFLHFDAQFFEDQVPCLVRGVEGERKDIRVVLPRAPPFSYSKPSPELTPDTASLWQSSSGPLQMAGCNPNCTLGPPGSLWSFMKKICMYNWYSPLAAFIKTDRHIAKAPHLPPQQSQIHEWVSSAKPC